MDKAASLHSAVPAPPPRLYLPRNFSCSACLYGSLAERCRGGCSPDGDAPPPPPPPPPAPRDAAPEKPPPPPRGREPSLPAVPPSPTQRRRAKSLPTPGERGLRPAPQHSPSRRKTVRFADSLGLELISVRHFCEADLPQVPPPAPPRHADLFKTRKPPALGELEPVPFGPPPPPLEPLFPPQPGAGPGFAERVRQHKVRLEWVRSEPAGLRGAVRVLNLAYEKAVSVRYTLDRWASCSEVPAAYQPAGPADGLTDRFAFHLPLGPAAAGSEAALEFAVRYRVAGAEYWDNNGGANYRLRGRARSPSSGPPQDPDSSAWIHFI
ncbi:protein phosphatase 1 regulatory subunit 3E [Gallus gallus]|uniref:protein phosphatase 1 regulatory subunit 3E n=1 Tax=Gallus gallus TaxID=9031 RepID=UPI000739E6C3|nr:protein phosphatase 1 regulatory subunit 3E [Gallus gallus]